MQQGLQSLFPGVQGLEAESWAEVGHPIFWVAAGFPDTEWGGGAGSAPCLPACPREREAPAEAGSHLTASKAREQARGGGRGAPGCGGDGPSHRPSKRPALSQGHGPAPPPLLRHVPAPPPRPGLPRGRPPARRSRLQVAAAGAAEGGWERFPAPARAGEEGAEGAFPRPPPRGPRP